MFHYTSWRCCVENGYDWIHVKLEEIDFPDVVECDFTDAESCQECRYRFKCELKA